MTHTVAGRSQAVLVLSLVLLASVEGAAARLVVDLEPLRPKPATQEQRKFVEAARKRQAEFAKDLRPVQAAIQYQQAKEPRAALKTFFEKHKPETLGDLAPLLESCFLAKEGKPEDAAKLLRTIIAKRGSPLRRGAELAAGVLLKRGIVASTDRVFRIGETVQIQLRAVGAEQARCRLYALDLAAAAKSYSPFARSLDFPQQKPIREWEETLEGQETKSAVAKNEGLQPGVYVLEASVGDVADEAPFFVSDAALSGMSMGDRQVYFLCDAKTGAPITDAEVAFVAPWGYLASAKTDADGSVETRWRGALIACASTPKGPAVLQLRPQGTPSIGTPADRVVRCYLYTDRPIYRPGQTVRFRGIIREVKDGELALSPERRIQVTFKDPRGRVVDECERALSAFGTYDGKFYIGERCQLGDFYVESRLLPIPEGSEAKCARTYFAVEAYRKPEITLSLEPTVADLAEGEETALRLVASYFHREPVPNARFDWQSRGEGQQYLAAGRHGWDQRTDKNGEAYISVKAGRPPKRCNVTITVRLRTDSRRVYTASTLLHLAPKPEGEEAGAKPRPQFAVEPDKPVYHPGDTARLRCHAPPEVCQAVLLVHRERLMKTIPVKLEDGTAEILLPIEKEYLGDVNIDLVAVRHRVSRQLRVQPRHSQVTVEAALDKPGYRPGEVAMAKLTSRDAAGAPVRAELSLSLVDEAIYAVAAEEITPVDRFFYPPGRRWFEPVWTRWHDLVPRSARHQLLEMYRNGRVSDLAASIFGAQSLLELQQQKQQRAAQAFLPNAQADFGFGQALRTGGLLASLLRLPQLHVTSVHGAQGIEQQGDQPSVQVLIQTLTIEVDGNDLDTAQPQPPLGINLPLVVTLNSPRMGGPPGARPPQPESKRPAIHYEGTLRMGRSSSASSFHMGKGGGGYEMVRTLSENPRTFFPDTALWQTRIVTDARGEAHVRLPLPDTITSWRITTRAATATAFAAARAAVVSRKPFFLTLHHPRTLREGDATTVAVMVHNDSDEPRSGRVRFSATGIELTEDAEKPFTCEANRTCRLDWPVRVGPSGTAVLTAAGEAGRSDAVRVTVPVLPWGSRCLATHVGSLEDGGEESAELTLPDDFDPARASVSLRVFPSTYEVVCRELRSLAQYPYGCVEQTMSRFMPDVLVAQALKAAKIEDRTLQAELPKMVSRGLQALYGYQNDDGGWVWFRERQSDPFMTAYVLWGLGQAKGAGYGVDQNVLTRGVDALRRLLQKEKLGDAKAYMAMSLAAAEGATPTGNRAVYDVFAAHESLRPHGLAFLMMALDAVGLTKEAKTLGAKLLSQATDSERGLQWPGSRDRSSRFQQFSGIEVSGYALRALALAGGEAATLDRAAKSLALALGPGRCPTKEAAAAVYGLAEHLRVRGITKDEQRGFVLRINGKEADRAVPPNLFRPGANAIDAKLAKGSLLYTLAVECFSRDRDLKPGGTLFVVTREYYAAPPTGANPREELDLAKLPKASERKVGEDLVVAIRLTAKQPARYVIIEDPIPSGFEIVDRSWLTQRERDRMRWQRHPAHADRFTHAEARDDRMTFFLSEIPSGKERTILYRLKAETPGEYAVMPAQAFEMYEPTKGGNSGSARLTVND